jgi:hypothetical protein
MTSESNIERWHRRRNAWFTENGPCQAHNIWNWSDVRREIELAKCQVLCRPCHIEKSILEGSISQPGERNARAILTTEDVIYIRTCSDTGVSLAAQYGVATTTISAIRRGINWRHVIERDDGTWTVG